jgi:hypothetical protein
MIDPSTGIQPSSSLVYRISKALDWIQKLSIVYLILKHNDLHQLPVGAPRGAADVLVDRVVLSLTGAAMIIYALCSLEIPLPSAISRTVGAVVIVISALRIADIVSFHLNMVLGRPGRPGGVTTVASYERSFVLLLLNYIEVMLWFASWYFIAVKSGLFIEAPSPLPLTVLRESLATMLVNAPSIFKPGPFWLVWTAICLQSLVGLFLTIIIVARTVSALPPIGQDSELSGGAA